VPLSPVKMIEPVLGATRLIIFIIRCSSSDWLTAIGRSEVEEAKIKEVDERSSLLSTYFVHFQILLF
jgi:hypothetical protein